MNTLGKYYYEEYCMSRATMLAILEEELTADEEKPIQPLTETPAKVYTPKNLTDAEDEIQEKDKEAEDKDTEYREEHNDDEENPEDTVGSIGDMNTSDDELDEKLMQFTIHQLISTPFLMEYGTPSGSDNGLCPTCGTEDAADAAIIDNEISGAERTEPFGTINNNGSTGGDYGSDENGGDDFGMDFTFQKTFTMSGMEDNSVSDILLESGKVFLKVLMAVAKYTTRFVRYMIHIAETNLIHVRYLSKFYHFKLKKLINFVDEDYINSRTIEAWPVSLWLNINKTCQSLYTLFQNMPQQLTMADAEFDAVVKEYDKLFSSISVNITERSEKQCVSELYLKRESKSAIDLGYDKAKILAILQQLDELADITNYLPISKALVACKDRIVKHVKSADDHIKENDTLITKDKERHKFFMKITGIYVILTAQLINDIYDITKIYENSIITDKLR